jgi:hypothetical protein
MIMYVRRVRDRVMIELLVKSGVTWAGWYRPENLHAKFYEASPFRAPRFVPDPERKW